MKNKLSKNERIRISLLIPFMLCIIGPLEIYTGNLSEFNFYLYDFIFYCILSTIVVFVVFYSFFSFIPCGISKYFYILALYFVVMSYLQNMFLNKGIANTDGSKVEWDNLQSEKITNLIIWVVIFVIVLFISFIKRDIVYSVSVKLSTIILAIFIVEFIGLVVTALGHKGVDNNYVLSGRNQYELGYDQNIIVLLLDEYSNEDFEEMLELDNDLCNELKDFTYFSNADSHYCYTLPSIPHILSGVEVDTTIEKEEWLEKIWKEEKCSSFYEELHNSEYICEIYPGYDEYVVLGDYKNIMNCFDNVDKKKPRTNGFLIYRLFEKMTLYKYVPIVAKEPFEQDYNVFTQTVIYDLEDGSIDYYNGKVYEHVVNKGLKVSDDIKNKYSFYHLGGCHGPYNTAADGTYMEDSTIEDARLGINELLKAYIQELKGMGKYEDSLIIIMADHGMHTDKNKPQPIFFIKKPYENNDKLKVSTAPISFDEYNATILDSLGLNYTKYGKSMFEWSDDDIRERELWYPEGNQKFIVYTYTGDRNQIKEKIANNDYKEVPAAGNWTWDGK